MMAQQEKPAVNSLAAAYEKQVLGLAAQVAAHGFRAETLAYGPKEHQLLDIFAPDCETSGGLPVMLFFHGGGFTHGHRRWNHFMAPLILATPMLFVSVSYRHLDEASRGPVQLDDVAQALGWARREMAAKGGDPDRLFVGGHSAGAALAAAITMRPDLLEPVRVPVEAIRGALCLSSSFGRYAITGTSGADYTLPEGELPINPDAPLALTGAARTPMLIGWGGRERQRARVERSSMAMIEALRTRGISVDWMFLEEADHFDTHLVLAEMDHPWSRRIKLWLNGLS